MVWHTWQPVLIPVALLTTVYTDTIQQRRNGYRWWPSKERDEASRFHSYWTDAYLWEQDKAAQAVSTTFGNSARTRITMKMISVLNSNRATSLRKTRCLAIPRECRASL